MKEEERRCRVYNRAEETLEHILNKSPWTMHQVEKKNVVKDDGSGISHLKRIMRRIEAVN